MKRILDSTGCSLIMRVEDRQTSATLIIEYQGKRIETDVSGARREAALEAYKCRDVDAFGELLFPTPKREGMAA